LPPLRKQFALVRGKVDGLRGIMISIRKLPLPLWERVGVSGTKIKYIYIPNHYHPHPGPPRSCEKIPKITPTLPLPRQGGGNLLLISMGLPSPPRGEGRVRGHIPIFSHLQGGWGDFRRIHPYLSIAFPIPAWPSSVTGLLFPPDGVLGEGQEGVFFRAGGKFGQGGGRLPRKIFGLADGIIDPGGFPDQVQDIF